GSVRCSARLPATSRRQLARSAGAWQGRFATPASDMQREQATEASLSWAGVVASNPAAADPSDDTGGKRQFTVAPAHRDAVRAQQEQDKDLRHSVRLGGAVHDEHGILRDTAGALLVPLAGRRRVMEQLHGESLHQAGQAMHKAAAGWVAWPGMRADLDKFAKECAACQHLKPVQDESGAGEMAHQRARFREWHLDLAFCKPEGSEEQAVIFTAMEDATGYLVNEVLVSKEPPVVLSAFARLVWHFSGQQVQVIRVDKGTEFQGLFRKGVEQLGIEVKDTPVGDNNSIGRLERSHAELKKALRRRAMEHPGTGVSEHVPGVTAAMNAAKAPGQTVSPWEALFGLPPQPSPALAPLIVAHSLEAATAAELAWSVGASADGAARDMARVRDERSAKVGQLSEPGLTLHEGDLLRYQPRNGMGLTGGAIAYGPYFVTRVHPNRTVDLAPADVPWETIQGLTKDGSAKPGKDWQLRVAIRSVAKWCGPVVPGETPILLPKSAEKARGKAVKDAKAETDKLTRAKKKAEHAVVKSKLSAVDERAKTELKRMRSRLAEINRMKKADLTKHAAEKSKLQAAIGRAKRATKRAAS
ncbi:MAG: hypothetical protein SXU28_15170, partial [Pseudomonadota bacterium]|nr:hypothetical protein [Pseudomonadota bacterium]